MSFQRLSGFVLGWVAAVSLFDVCLKRPEQERHQRTSGVWWQRVAHQQGEQDRGEWRRQRGRYGRLRRQRGVIPSAVSVS